MCPSDTYKVYKQGSNVRIDTTLLGFDHANWQQGNRSYVFKGQSKLCYELYSIFTCILEKFENDAKWLLTFIHFISIITCILEIKQKILI